MSHGRFLGLRKSEQLYGNCRVLTGDTLMFRCDEERRDWYLSSGLAEVVSEEPQVIRLTFKPKGPGHAGDPYFLPELWNPERRIYPMDGAKTPAFRPGMKRRPVP